MHEWRGEIIIQYSPGPFVQRPQSQLPVDVVSSAHNHDYTNDHLVHDDHIERPKDAHRRKGITPNTIQRGDEKLSPTKEELPKTRSEQQKKAYHLVT